jgi:hypothetical protein
MFPEVRSHVIASWAVPLPPLETQRGRIERPECSCRDWLTGKMPRPKNRPRTRPAQHGGRRTLARRGRSGALLRMARTNPDTTPTHFRAYRKGRRHWPPFRPRDEFSCPNCRHTIPRWPSPHSSRPCRTSSMFPRDRQTPTPLLSYMDQENMGIEAAMDDNVRRALRADLNKQFRSSGYARSEL